MRFRLRFAAILFLIIAVSSRADEPAKQWWSFQPIAAAEGAREGQPGRSLHPREAE